jgi:hypothetical protein
MKEDYSQYSNRFDDFSDYEPVWEKNNMILGGADFTSKAFRDGKYFGRFGELPKPPDNMASQEEN